MKGLLIVTKGGEEVAKQELKELLNLDGKIVKEAVEFSFENFESIFKLAYFSQSAQRILVLDDLSNWLKEGTTFRVRCEDKDNEGELGAQVNKDDKFKVDLNNPQVPLFQHNEYLGIDFTGELSKRNFRVFTHRQSLKGTTAFILLKEAGFTGKEILLDPFAKDGTVVLEAVHYSIKKPVKYFEREIFPFLKFEKFNDFNSLSSLEKKMTDENMFWKENAFDFEEFFESFKEEKCKSKIYGVSGDLRDISALKKNGKIAGLTDFSVSKLAVDWLDTKFKENELDLVVSYPPKLSLKLLKQLYHQLSYIAKKVILLVEKDFNYEDNNLKIEKEKVIFVGKVEKKIIFLKRTNVDK